MIANQYALIRREFWEHRSLYVVPAVLGLVIVLIEMTGQAAISAFGTQIDMTLLSASNIDTHQRATIISALMTAFASLFLIEMWILSVFYALDSLYAERKDKSILFWRSMPVTDAETVISKLLTAIIAIPIVTIIFVALTHVLVLLVISIWIGTRGASPWHLIWSAVPLVDNWTATILYIFAQALWLSPFVGWFLLVSAFAKRSPLLMAVLPIIVLPMLEKSILNSRFLFDAIVVRSVHIPISHSVDFDKLFSKDALAHSVDHGISLLGMLDIGRFLASPGLWLGLLVCALLSAGAIYVRRFRDES